MPEYPESDQSPAPGQPARAELPDAELTERIRAGAPTAYPATQELRRRHLPAVQSYARLCGRDHAAAKQLAEQTLAIAGQETCRGVTPRGTWRHHLLMLVQQVAFTWAADTRRARLAPDFAAWVQATGNATPNRLAPRGPRPEESSALLGGFYRLPERAQGVLWYAVVEEESDATVAAFLGVAQDSVAGLRPKARRAMCQAYLRTYLERTGGEACREFRRLAEAVAEPGELRRSEELDQHLAECLHCTVAFAELLRLADDPRTTLAEGLLRWGGSAYLAAIPERGTPPGLAWRNPPAPAAAGTGAQVAALPSGPGSAGTSARDAVRASRPTAFLAVAAAAAAALVATPLVVTFHGSDPVGSSAAPPAPPTATVTATVSETAQPPASSAPPQKSAPAPEPATSSAAAPQPTAPAAPSPTPTPVGADDGTSLVCVDLGDGKVEQLVQVKTNASGRYSRVLGNRCPEDAERKRPDSRGLVDLDGLVETDDLLDTDDLLTGRDEELGGSSESDGAGSSSRCTGFSSSTSSGSRSFTSCSSSSSG